MGEVKRDLLFFLSVTIVATVIPWMIGENAYANRIN